MKYRLTHLLCALVLSPIWPFYILRGIGLGLVAFADWAVEGRQWCQPIVNLTEHLERKFGPMADDEYEAWRKRMGFKR